MESNEQRGRWSEKRRGWDIIRYNGGNGIEKKEDRRKEETWRRSRLA